MIKMSQKKNKQQQQNKIRSRSLYHRRIILIITAGWVMELEALPEVQLVLLYTEVNGVNLLLHGRDGLQHG
jgi:hypothetical protein